MANSHHLLPLGHRTVGNDEGSRFAYHRPPAFATSKVAWSFAPEQVDQQNWKGGLVHLQAVPIRTSIQPHVLRPVAIRLLGGFKVVQDAESIVRSSRREQSSGALNQVARSDQVIATEILISFIESPRDGKAGN